MGTELVRLDPKDVALRIQQALAGGLVAAAKVYREYCEAGGDPMALRHHIPASGGLWQTLDDMAYGRLDPRSMLAPIAVQKALRMLPAAIQADLLSNGVEILTADNSSMRVRLQHLDARQTGQVFGPSGVRSVAEQAAYLKATVPTAAMKTAPVPFEVKAGKLRVYEPTVFDMATLAKLMGQMA